MDSESYTFGPYKIIPKEVFYSTQFSYAMVNLRPIVPGMLHNLFNLQLCLIYISPLIWKPIFSF